jgi:hypothetical protein
MIIPKTSLPQMLAHTTHHWLVQAESSTWATIVRLSCRDHTAEHALGEP